MFVEVNTYQFLWWRRRTADDGQTTIVVIVFSSSSLTASSNFSDSLSLSLCLFVPIIHRPRQVFQTTSFVCAEVL